MIKVLFIDQDNGALSQMAACCLERYGKNNFLAETAGLKDGSLNLYMMQVLEENHYDPFWLAAKSVYDFIKRGVRFDYIVSFITKHELEKVQMLLAKEKMIYWNLPDPNDAEGTEEELMDNMRSSFKIITHNVRTFVKEFENQNHLPSIELLAPINFAF